MSDEAVAAPWQNRPSILSTWEHSVSGFDLSGDGIIDFSPLIVMDNLQTDPRQGTNPVCVPRACRMTRVCVNFLFDGFETTNAPIVVLAINRSQDCGDDGYPLAGFVAFDLLNRFPIDLNCACEDLNVLFDECDQWFPIFFTLGGADPIFPRFRIIFHFELR